MDSPIFRLTGVVHVREEEALQDFVGPLDLILYLLSRNKMEIQNIQISLILDQYREYIEHRRKLDLEVASEFVTMAAHLVYIKTRMILSIEDEEAQSEMSDLIRSLEERKRSEDYAKIKDIAGKLAVRGEFGRDIITKPPEPVERGKIYEYDQEKADLVLALQDVLDRAGEQAPPPLSAFDGIVMHDPYPVQGKASEIVSRIIKHGMTRFLLLFRGNKSRSEVVATFLAVLELCRARAIKLAGSETDCTVSGGENLSENITL
ncbi:MAG: segregation/condensation protein A [Oscillospiraceae bacterium]|nr:segregation/condensation protein A [Oscillospiraceae bacterium]